VTELDRCVDELGSTVLLFCKGDVSPEEFQQGIDDWNERQIGPEDVNDHIHVNSAHIHQTIARWVPIGPNQAEFESYHCRLDYPTKPGRGAFKITYVDLDRCI
jgi:hypothetical protein